MKRGFNGWILAVSLVFGLTGCKGQNRKAEDMEKEPQVVLTVSLPLAEWGGYAEELAAMYQETHPEIKAIQWNLVDRSMYSGLLRVSLASRKMPDIIYVGFGCSMEEWKDHLLPLNDMEALTKLPNAYRNMGMLDGVIYSVPLQIQGIGIVYNRELLKQAGWDEIPGTMPEFSALCQRFEEMDMKPIMNHYKETLLTMGGNLFMLPAMSQDNPEAYMKELLTEGRQQEYEENWHALADFFDLTLKYVNRDSLTTGVSVARDYFFIQKYAMLNDEGSWLAPALKRNKPSLEERISIGCIPLYEEADRNRLPLEVQSLSIVKGGENQEEAKEVLNWLVSSKEASEYLKESMGCLPVMDMNNDSLEGLSPLASQVKAMILDGETTLDVINCLPVELRNKSAELWGRYLTGDLSREEVLQDFQSLWKDYMNQE